MSFEVTIQKLHDSFCESSHVYSRILDREGNPFTDYSAQLHEAQDFYIDSLITEEVFLDTRESFGDENVENIVDLPSPEGVYMSAVAMRSGGMLKGIWFVIVNAADSPLCKENPLTKRLSRDEFNVRLALLENICKLLFSEQAEKEALLERLEEIEYTRNALAKQLRQSETLTEIIKQMESKEDFNEVTFNILKSCGTYLEISTAFLMQLNEQEDTVSIVCEWKSLDADSLMPKITDIKRDEIPFFNGKSYTVSTDSLMPDSFAKFFESHDISAGVFLPVEINKECAMYLGFCMCNSPRKWAVDQVSFLNDVKRIIQTILQKRIVKNSLASSYAVVESTLDKAGCGICVTDKETGEALYTNELFDKMLSDAFDKRDFVAMLKASSPDMEMIKEYHLKKVEKYIDIVLSDMKWVDSRDAKLCTIYEVSEYKVAQESIEERANTDETTGLPNRNQFNKDFVSMISKSIQTDTTGAICYINLDDFKDINDALGHKVGDKLLKLVSVALLKASKNYKCYRVGGDEFAILLPNCSRSDVELLSSKIKRRFEMPWQLSYSDYYCTMCMGIAQFPQDGSKADTLIQRADIALRAAKKHGRNIVEFFSPKEEEGAIHRLDLEKELRHAVMDDCKEFEVFYQPIIDFSKEDHPCCGAEALVRWNSKKFGMVMPSDFINMAEYLGLIVNIGEHVMLEAATRCKYWNDFGHPDYHVNVNVSVVQLMQSDIVSYTKSVLKDTGIIPEHLTLEVTESVAGYDIDNINIVLSKLRDTGVKLALDDFGTGYSSLSRLKKMPMDVIKIDKSFIDDLGKDIFSDAFVRTVSELADTINVDVVVEGVEKGDQLGELSKVKADMIQGYYYDKPLSREGFESKYVDNS